MALYVDTNGGGAGAQSFCGHSVPNLAAIPGPSNCNFFGTWNDCVSSVRVHLGPLWCLRMYRDANYGGEIARYSGSMSDRLFNLPVNDVLSSFQFYQKANPAASC